MLSLEMDVNALQVARIVLLWANNHFNDFECNTEMMNLLDRFEHALERDQMHSQQVCSRIVIVGRQALDKLVHSNR